MNEIDHLKNELSDSRHQLQHCLAEVKKLFSKMYLVFLQTNKNFHSTIKDETI